MWSAPVTFGGGITIQNGFLPAGGVSGAAKRFFVSQTSYHFFSTSFGS